MKSYNPFLPKVDRIQHQQPKQRRQRTGPLRQEQHRGAGASDLQRGQSAEFWPRANLREVRGELPSPCRQLFLPGSESAGPATPGI